MSKNQLIPIDVAHLLPALDQKLLELLRSLSPEEWQRQTIARLWKVKDVVAHLLDTNIRVISLLRDGFFGEQAPLNSYQDLVDFLNQLNAHWVQAMKRVSPQMLIALHEATGPTFCDHLRSLDPLGTSTLSVAWAGEEVSLNWMEVAREYTEKWLHQQQIRDAVNKPGIMTREFFYPFINTLMQALPYTYRHMDAPDGTWVQMTIATEIGGTWHLQRTGGAWKLTDHPEGKPSSVVITDPDTSWKLFSKSLRPHQVMDKVTIRGDLRLGETALSMVSVMA